MNAATNTKSKRNLALGCGIGLLSMLAVCVAAYIAFLTNCTLLEMTAYHGAMEFQGWSEEYSMASTFSPEKCPLYLDLPRAGPVRLSELTEEHLQEGFTRDVRESDRAGYDTIYEGLGATFKFQKGKLTAMHFSGDKLRFSKSKSGPWLTLPVSPARLKEVFGPPDMQDRRRVDKPIRWT